MVETRTREIVVINKDGFPEASEGVMVGASVVGVSSGAMDGAAEASSTGAGVLEMGEGVLTIGGSVGAGGSVAMFSERTCTVKSLRGFNWGDPPTEMAK